MEGVGGVEVVCGGACGAEGRGDLASDDAALAYAGDDDAVLSDGGPQEEIDGLGEGREHGAVEAEGQVGEGGGFDADEVGGEERICRVGGCVGHGCRTMSMLAEGEGGVYLTWMA